MTVFGRSFLDAVMVIECVRQYKVTERQRRGSKGGKGERRGRGREGEKPNEVKSFKL